MEEERCREFFGSIIKEEKVINLNRFVLPNTFVLEANEPFPGYYGNNPKNDLPRIYFLITHEKYSFEKIIRISKQIQNEKNVYFEATLGNIDIDKRNYSLIRIKALDRYFTISELQELFLEKGIQFQKPINYSGTAIIRLNKFFLLESMGDNMYYEYDKNEIGYFPLPKFIKWDDFKCLTTQVRNNWNIHGFDAAQGIVYKNWEVIDIVRIFHKKLSFELLKTIKEKYEREFHIVD